MMPLSRITLITLTFLFSWQISEAQHFWKRSIRGEGPITSREISLESFSGISNGYAAKVYLRQGEQKNIKLSGQANILDNLRLEVKNHVLKIRYDRMVRRAEPVEIFITLPTLDLVKLSGSSRIVSEEPFRGLGDVTLSVSGSGGIYLDLDAKEIEGKVSGSGNIDLDGSAEAFLLSISGSGNIHAQDLDLNHCDASVSGSGDARLKIKESLVASVSGSGNIVYEGDDIRIDSKVSGSGSVRSR